MVFYKRYVLTVLLSSLLLCAGDVYDDDWEIIEPTIVERIAQLEEQAQKLSKALCWAEQYWKKRQEDENSTEKIKYMSSFQINDLKQRLAKKRTELSGCGGNTIEKVFGIKKPQ